MSDFTAGNAEDLLEPLRKELDVLGQVRELTEKQAELIAADDIDGFNRSLDSRQGHIEKINGLHQESDVLMQSYMSYLDSAGGKSIKEIDEALAQIRDALAECTALNDSNITAAKEKAEGYIKQIGKLSLNRKNIGAYIQDVENKPEMFDKKM